MQVDLAAHAPHNRKHGAAFAESWSTSDGTTVVAVGSVFSGTERTEVGDLLRTAARTLITSRSALAGAIPALDRIVRHHARERRDDSLAAAVALLVFEPGETAALDAGGTTVALVGAGHLSVAIIDGAGAQTALHAAAAPLGSGIEAPPAGRARTQGDGAEPRTLHRGDLVVAATVPLDPAWWASGDRGAAALLARSDEPEKAAAVIAAD